MDENLSTISKAASNLDSGDVFLLLTLLLIFSLIIFIPTLILKSKLHVFGIPIRKDFYNPTARESFDEYINDVQNCTEKISIVTGELDYNVYDSKEIKSGKLCLIKVIEQKLKEGITVELFTSNILTISDEYFLSNSRDPKLNLNSKKITYGDNLASAEEMSKASDILRLVLEGVELNDQSYINRIKLYAMKDHEHRHFRIRDYGKNTSKLYVEYHHSPLIPVHRFYTITNSLFKIQKYFDKVLSLHKKADIVELNLKELENEIKQENNIEKQNEKVRKKEKLEKEAKIRLCNSAELIHKYYEVWQREDYQNYVLKNVDREKTEKTFLTQIRSVLLMNNKTNENKS